MAALLSYLPPFEGLLPKWLFLVSVVSAANSIQAYRSESYAADLYNGRTADGRPHTNALSARTFGTWTFLSSIVRLYAAYYITTPAVYDLALWTFGIALLHFVGEWVAFGSAQLKGRFVSPLIVASSTLTWMLTQREWYLSA
ncbi:ergosterol biosynthesis protein Erg28 [Aspergillus heteromorphus CBS 117.55]|uniref:Ergosterol biosynthesis protein Erg28 n=1 Tax=Aspergillus heteromorphus CBS 117.55 TaxID=1448321 RepID=A0A317W5I2_9EURO|nr:ergosterol biosynthesis protein Erg28 [Aspergillus heteromorphus CBS 117.55]PWY80487.1 ergosterol biosynthesis protein Erg28 [Aspergillus heteromorphus CBS 117.55]